MPKQTPFEKFKRLAGKIVAVPKREADAIAAKEKKEKAKTPSGVSPSGA